MKDTAIGLFEVYDLYSREVLMVYGVDRTKDWSQTFFLLYLNGKWVWSKSELYEPKL